VSLSGEKLGLFSVEGMGKGRDVRKASKAVSSPRGREGGGEGGGEGATYCECCVRSR